VKQCGVAEMPEMHAKMLSPIGEGAAKARFSHRSTNIAPHLENPFLTNFRTDKINGSLSLQPEPIDYLKH